MTSRGWNAPRPGGGFVTLAPVVWEVGRDGSGAVIEVPPAFDFDVSIPRWLTWLFDPLDRRYLRAACLHDWLLQDRWGRLAAGAVFAEALAAEGVASWRRLLMWLAVSLYRWA